MIPPRRLVLSGGGIRVVSFVGALKVLEEKGYLSKIKEVCGVSAGAFLGFLVASGYPVKKIESLIIDLDFGIIRHITPEAFLGFPESFGLDDGERFVKFLESIFRVVLKVDPGLTLGDFAKMNRPNQVKFRCWATDLNSSTIREFSGEKTPGVRIIEALRASMALPFYFTPSIDPITGHMLTDGGVQGNLPLHHLRDDECEDSLSLAFSSKVKDSIDKSIPQDLMEFVNSLFSSLKNSRNNTSLNKWSHKIIYVDGKNYPSWNFEASREDRKMLMEWGSEAVHSWLLNPPSRNTERRHSF